MRKTILTVLAVVALATPALADASPPIAETPGTTEARKQVEIARSITDPDEYLAFVKSLADYDHARGYGDKH
jgi:hypothetical protein